MKIVGIVAEYNPFHNGHAYQIAQARRRGADAVVCVCSPGLVQRGEAAQLPAWVRTRAALAGGADLLLSLPAPCAVLSAEGFAAAGVALLDALGCVDELCFGTDTLDASAALQTARLLDAPAFPAALRRALDAGLPLPAARAAAANALCPGADAALHGANDILAVEYCKAVLRSGSSLRPLALPRTGAAHDAPLEREAVVPAHGKQLLRCSSCGEGRQEAFVSAPGTQPLRRSSCGEGRQEAFVSAPGTQPLRCSSCGEDEQETLVPTHDKQRGANAPASVCSAPPGAERFASASALRRLAEREGVEALAPYVPGPCLEIYRAAWARGEVLSAPAFSTAALALLRTKDIDALRRTRGANEGLENRLSAAVRQAGSWEALIEALKTKRYATARLRRFALNAALGFTEELPPLPPYLHILGASQTGLAVLRRAGKTARLPLSASLARLAQSGPEAACIARAHAAAEDFFALCLRRPAPMGRAYTVKPVMP